MIHVLPEIVYLSNSAGINNCCFQIEIVRKIGGYPARKLNNFKRPKNLRIFQNKKKMQRLHKKHQYYIIGNKDFYAYHKYTE